MNQLQKNVHKFVDDIVEHSTNPSIWPLSQQEQIAFIRRVVGCATEIVNSDEYMSEAIVMAKEELAKNEN